MNFEFGSGSIYGKSFGNYVRAVRGGTSSDIDRFIDNGDGTVNDTVTGLIWQQASAEPVDWESALSYCENISIVGHSDWRLPNMNELISIREYSANSIGINSEAFPDTVPSEYWSSTTDSYSKDYSEVVRYSVDVYGDETFDNKLDNNYTRCVRGEQTVAIEPLAGLDHFEFSTIDEQSIDTSFPVTITAKKANGDVATDFTGTAALSSVFGGVHPTSVWFENGQATVSVSASQRGNGNQLTCDHVSRSGKSNEFNVVGGDPCDGRIKGGVFDFDGNNVAAEITLRDHNNNIIDTYNQLIFNSYSFNGLDCGRYTVTASNDQEGLASPEKTVYVSNSLGHKRDLTLGPDTSVPKTPVILIPGIMGSHNRNDYVYPSFRGTYPDMDIEILKPDKYGWDDLKDKLRDAGFIVYECPWDWRGEVAWNVEKFLRPMILRAKAETNANAVHLVSHSMGGLLARAYIQSGNYDDIVKLVMVGTPNLGSCHPYWIWEGGDPKTLDDLVTNDPWNIYTNVIQALYEETYHLHGWKNDKHDMIREFVRNKAPSMRQLMHTEDFLTDEKNSDWGTSAENENRWLKDLNSGLSGYQTPGSVMSGNSVVGKVQVKLFAGNDHETIGTVITKEKYQDGWNNELYEDGIYVGKRSHPGDGTVPYDSAAWPDNDGWAKLDTHSSSKAHSKLMADSEIQNRIVTFLTGTAQGAAATDTQSALPRQAQASVAESTAVLSIGVKGDIRFYVADPSGNFTGINPSTLDAVNGIPNTHSAYGESGASISIDSPVDGQYMVTFFGEAERNFHLGVGYEDDEHTDYLRKKGFKPAAPTSFTITVDSTATPLITLTPFVPTPTGLQAGAYVSGGNDRVRLSWNEVSDPSVTGYRIYSVGEKEPYFTEIATVAAGTSSYDTNDVYKLDESVPLKTYAVSAVKSDGTESFFSGLVQNNDRDHDGITDAVEFSGCTDLLDVDSDDDGLADGAEDVNANGIVDYGETSPCSDNTDFDGIKDGTEMGVTEPIPDPDGDGPIAGTDPTYFTPDLDPTTTTDPTNPDTDGDGLRDGEEDANYNGRVDDGETDPNVNSDDNYEPNDYFEDAWYPNDGLSWENKWISTFDGLAIQRDWDLYKIIIKPGYEKIEIECIYNPGDGNIAIGIYNPRTEWLYSSTGEQGNAAIETTVPEPGEYLIKVYDSAGGWGGDGVEYDLRWQSIKQEGIFFPIKSKDGKTVIIYLE